MPPQVKGSHKESFNLTHKKINRGEERALVIMSAN